MGTVSAMSSPGARIVLIVLGVIALIAGVIWVGQGMGLIPGSFMTGDRTWLLIGLIVGVVGIVLIALGLRRRGRRPTR
jgi:type VI protein secretion system component VasK